MAGSMIAFGIIIGIVIALVVVRGLRRRAVDQVFPIAFVLAAALALLALLTGHGLASLGAAALFAVGELVGVVGTAVVGPRALDALEGRR